MALTKITGWILLLAGLFIIGWSLYSSYQIFTAKKPAPEIFPVSTNEEKDSTSLKLGRIENLEALQSQLQTIFREQLKQIIPLDFLPRLLNLTSFSIFVGILIFGGSKIAGLGIGLLKKK